MPKKLLISILTATLLIACTGSAGPASTSGPISLTASPTSPNPSVAPRTIALPHLPPQGVVVQRNGGVAFIALDGRVVAKLHGFELANPTEAPGPLLLRRDHAWYLLDTTKPELRRIGRLRAEHLRVRDDPAIELPTPTGMMVDGRPAGHWRFALLSVDGNRILAQWSGECEVPVAYLSTLQHGPPVPITGSAPPQEIPESFALGWTRGGRALVVLEEGVCGTGSRLPGVYAFDAVGAASLITTVPSLGLARMWGSS